MSQGINYDKDTKVISAVIVDTSAFLVANSDFLGVNSQLLPSFFAAIKEKGITLLTHPILENEIIKHLPDSSLVRNYNEFISYVERCEKILKYSDSYNIDFFNQLKAIDVRGKLHERYIENFSSAEYLKYPSAEVVFKKYFESQPPFTDCGKKKAEFPDAFIIASIVEYLNEHQFDILLVVSGDKDWEKSLSKIERVVFCERIDKALKCINSIESIISDEMINYILNAVEQELKRDVIFHLECECYDVPDYEFIDSFEMKNVTVKMVDDFVPLKISRNELLIKIGMCLDVSGSGRIFDEENSIWDSVDRCYFVKAYAELSVFKGEAYVEAEVVLGYDFDNPYDAMVSNIKLIVDGNINVEPVEYNLGPVEYEGEIIK